MSKSNTFSRLLVIGGWLSIVLVLVGVSVVADAKISTTVSLLVLGISPVIVMWLLAQHAAPPTVAEILHAAVTTDRKP